MLLAACYEAGQATTPGAQTRQALPPAAGPVGSPSPPAAGASPAPTTAVPPAPPATLGKLATVQDGDLWVQAVPDGEPRRLTTGGRVAEPRWSPSGEWLAFRRDTEVWVVGPEDGDTHTLEKGSAVDAFAWPPAADRLAFVAGGDAAWLGTVDAEGSNPQVLVPLSLEQPGQAGRLAWSPDGAWIAYEWREAGGLPGVWKASADGQQRVALLFGRAANEVGGARLLAWTGDGRFILFQSDMGSASLLADGSPLYALPAEGGSPEPLGLFVLAHEDFVVPEPLTTDRDVVVAGEFRGAWQNKALRLVQASGGRNTLLSLPDQAVSSPAWSPDGRQIAYVALPDQGETNPGGDALCGKLAARRLYVMDAGGGGGLRPLTEGSDTREERPLWSAGGSHVLLARVDAAGWAGLWLVPAGGGPARPVAAGLGPVPSWCGYYGHVAWERLMDWWRGP